MTIPNKTSKYVWQYQAAHGTAILVIAGSTSFEFGEYNDECGEWNSPFVENKSIPSWKYNTRTPTLTNLASEYPTFAHVYNPVTMQFLHWQLGTTADGTPTTVTCTSLNAGRKNPLTVRFQEDGGTRPNNAQALDCHQVGCTVKMERGKSVIVESEFAFGKLQDISDYVNLTTNPTAAGGCTQPYDGNPILTWDTGGDNNAIPEVWRAEFKCAQEHEKVSSDEGDSQAVYTYKQQPVQIILSAVLETLDPAVEGIWKDYMDRKATADMTIQVKKYNATNYMTFTFTNCRVNSVKKSGDRNEGHYGVVCTMEAEKVEGVSDWYTDHGGAPTFLTHWKTAALA